MQGDDIRALNWKATARSKKLMVNQFQDERSQQIINVIDTGRAMKMPFEGLHLLDYAINTSLVLANISLIKHDKAGLLSFGSQSSRVVKPKGGRAHLKQIQEALYKLETNFSESSFEQLLLKLNSVITQRSLIVLYTNFETQAAMERALPYLQQISRKHLLVVIFFENTEITSFLKRKSPEIKDIFEKAVAEQFVYEKEEMIRKLKHRGIHTIYTPPKELSVNALNKYLELKARGYI